MYRTSIADVRVAFELVSKVGAHILKDGESFVLQEGSPINGRAFRLHITGGEIGSGLSGAPETDFAGYIGWTKNDAFYRLHMIADKYRK
jgi:hypothetical protein